MPNTPDAPSSEQHKPSTRRHSWGFAAALGLGMLVVILLHRVPLITQDGAGFSPFDLSGMLRDLGILCLATAVITLVRPRWGHVVLLILLVVFLIIETGNASFISTFGHTVDLSQAGFILDPTFLLGSATKLQNPVAFGAGIFILVLSVWLAWRLHPTHRLRWMAGIGAGALCLSLILLSTRDVAPWRQSGILTQNAASMIDVMRTSPDQGRPSAQMAPVYAALDQELAGDMDGILWVDAPQNTGTTRPNILMVILEGLSGVYLPQIAQSQGLQSNIKMPRLEAFAKRGVIFSQFYSHQRQTTRGTYALLCGQLPRFSSEKPRLEIAADTQTALDCLPNRLGDIGYRRAYVQAAPLAFSRKNEALPLIGFQDLIGAKSFDPKDVGSAWGPHDGILFDRALSEMAALETAPEPWFMTVLNVGTHHPFDMVPPEFEGSDNMNIRSFEYLDVAVSDFLAKAEAQGLLDNTIVVLTSDESNGLSGESSTAIKELVRNWSLLAIVAPNQLSPRIDDRIAGQFDLPLSLFDLLGEPAPEHFMGRSLFRDYDTPRPLYAFNNIRNLSYVIEDGRIEMCKQKGRSCQTLIKSGAGIGTLTPQRGADEAPLQETAQNLILYTNRDVVLMDREVMPAGTEKTVTPDAPYLLCCRYADLPADHTFSFQADLQLVSDLPVTLHVDIVSQLEGEFSQHFSQKYAFLPGETISMGHILQAPGPLKLVELRMGLITDVPEARFVMKRSSMRVVKTPD